jgi:hypothetical protein
MMWIATPSAIVVLRQPPAKRVAEHPEDAFDRWKFHRWDLEFL